MDFSISKLWRRFVSPASAPVPATPPARPPVVTDRFERGDSLIGRIIERAIEDHFITPHDGFLAYDRQSKAITGGLAPTAVEHDTVKLGGTLASLARILAGEEHGSALSFSHGGVTATGTATHREAEQGVPIAGALGASIVGAVNPATGGLADLTVRASDDAPPARARVLALPHDYAGPIFVSDIDDTLRATSVEDIAEGETQPPIAGAREIVEGVAKLGVPIVYLSAGTTRIHRANTDFLAQLPAGILLDDRDWNPAKSSALDQAAYKLSVLQTMRATWPNAQLFALGDDKYGDAIAYTKAGARAYIHDVAAGDANIPPGFAGVQSKTYTPQLRARIIADVAAALAP